MPINELKYIHEFLLQLTPKLDLRKLNATEIDAYLGSREKAPFDSDWSWAYQEVEDRKNQLSKTTLQEIENLNEKLRKTVFKNIIKITDSPDLAGYISDDFGLIFDAFSISSLKKSWVFGLFDSYFHLKLPYGKASVLERPDIK